MHRYRLEDTRTIQGSRRSLVSNISATTTRCTGRPTVVILLSLLLLLLWIPTCRASYAITLEPDIRQCFFIRATSRPTTLSGNFDCWEEGETRLRGCRNVAAWIDQDLPKSQQKRTRNPNVWSSTSGKSEETFSVSVEGGKRYILCFESSKPTDEGQRQQQEDDTITTPYTLQLGFNIRVQSTEPRSLPDEEMGPDAQRALELLEAAVETEEQWQNLLDHFDFLRNREAMHRQLTGQINDRVMGWTIIEAVLVVTMAVGQVWYWKAFFEQRRYL